MTLGAGGENRNLRPRGSKKLSGHQSAISGVRRHLLDLPDDVIYVILSFCDLPSLGLLSLVCRRLTHLVSQDCVWLTLRKSLTQVRDNRWKNGRRPFRKLCVKEQCRYATNWTRGHCQDIRLIHHSVRQLPCLQSDGNQLWITYKNIIRCYRQQSDGHLKELSTKTLRGPQDDVGRFVVKDNMVVCGSRDLGIYAYSSLTGEALVHLRNCHMGDIQAVDSYQDVVVSGSRDTTVKLWNLNKKNTHDAHLKTLSANDRVWSVAMNPSGRSFAIGTAGINNVPPLRIWDTESTQLVAVLGNQYRHGAGVLDIQYETPDVLLSCGYDTFLRLWDLRTSHTHSVLNWEEPFDSTLYCVKSDGHHAVLAGTARHGMIRLWDKRHTKPVQVYYVGRGCSPVYSMVSDNGHLYIALDRGINMLDFTIPG